MDPDERILRRARRKMGGSARLEQASATQLPFASETFDRVLSTLTFHHLTSDEKIAAMREVFRVLKPAGEFHLGDFGQPDSWFMRIASFLTEKIGREHVQENHRGMLPAMLESAGFAMVHETARFGTAFGVLRCLRAIRRPAVFSEVPALGQD